MHVTIRAPKPRPAWMQIAITEENREQRYIDAKNEAWACRPDWMR